MRRASRALACVRILGAVGAGLVVSGGGARLMAQSVSCDSTLTVGDCANKLGSRPGTPAEAAKDAAKTATAATAAAKQTASQKSTGGDNAGTTATSTSLNNYLPRLAAAIAAPGFSGDTAALGLTLNTPFNDGVLFDFGFTAQVSVVAHKPALFSQIADKIPANIREAARKKLEGTFNDLDDAELGVALNFENQHFGRVFAKHAVQFDAIASGLIAEAERAVDNANRGVVRALEALVDPARKKDQDCQASDPSKLPMKCTAPGKAVEYATALVNLDKALAAFPAETKRIFEASGFDRVADLLNNQPQFNIGVSYRGRKELLGPSQFSAKATFEKGFANINRLRSYSASQKDCGEITATCFARFMNNQNVRESIDRGDRFAFSLKFESQPKYAAARKDTFDIALDRSYKLVPEITYGRYIGRQADGTDKGRLDFSAKYIRQLKDNVRQSQAIAGITMTQPMSDQTSAIFGVTWANKPEYVGTTDYLIRANVGLTYHLVNKAK